MSTVQEACQSDLLSGCVFRLLFWKTAFLQGLLVENDERSILSVVKNMHLWHSLDPISNVVSQIVHVHR